MSTDSAVADAGLGLTEFLGASTATPEGVSTPSREPETPAATEAPATADTEVKATPSADAVAAVPVVEPEKPSVNWDDEANPYKKRYADTASWGTKINQQLMELSRNQDIVGKKLDGTYDPAIDLVQPPSPVQIEERAMLRGKVSASEALAKEHYGQEYVEKTLSDFNAKFGNDQAIQGRVLSSAAPIVEAIKVMRETAFYQQYGSNPDDIVGKIKAQVEQELRPKIAAEEAKRFEDRLKQRDHTPTGLAGARGTGETSAPKAGAVSSLKDIFGA